MNIAYIAPMLLQGQSTPELDQRELAKAVVEYANRRYTLSNDRNPELDYDDRLSSRLGFGRTVLYRLIKAGQLKTCRIDGKHIITEAQVANFLQGDASVLQSSDIKAA